MKGCLVNDYYKSIFFLIGNTHGKGSLSLSSVLSVVPFGMEGDAAANLAGLQSKPAGEDKDNPSPIWCF